MKKESDNCVELETGSLFINNCEPLTTKANPFRNVYVNCEQIILTQKGLDIKVDLNAEIKNIEVLTINGINFIKEIAENTK